MRTKNSIKNVFWTCFVYAINIVVNFIARKVFLQFLGIEYNGLNSLFNSIISMLSLAELGIGSIIIYKLYDPISKGNKEEINTLMSFYKKCYNVLALIIFIIGILLIPFIPKIVGQVNVPENILYIYILFLLNSVFSYLLTYKRSILIANQEERIIKKIHLIYIIISNVAQIALLYFTQNYYLYLIIRMIFTILENVCISLKANKLYPYLKQKAAPLDVETKKDLVKRIKSMFFHQIGGFVVNGTDNVLLSIFFGVASVGYYNNYFLVISSLISFVDSIFSAVIASVGNLLSSANKKSIFKVYDNMNFINFLIASYTACIFLMLIQKFITWWIGKENLLSISLAICLTVYYYLRVMKFTTASFKNAAGIVYEDRFIPIIESFVNIIASIALAKIFGISGIIMGTIISTLVLYIYSYPRYVYRKLFDKKISGFYFLNLKYLVFTLLFVVISFLINDLLVFNNFIFEAIKVIVITSLIYGIMVLVVYHKDSRFLYVKNIFNNIIKKNIK